MNKRPALTFAFLQHRPAAAAEVVEELDPAEAAAFFDTVPTRLAAPVFEHMTPFIAARCLQRMSPEHGAASLRLLPAHHRTGLLRQMAERERGAILDALPERLRKGVLASLSYPSGSVGAALDPDIPVFNNDVRVGTARRSLSPGLLLSHLFLADAKTHQFAGAVRLTDLILANEAAVLGELDIVAVQPLYNHASLASAGIDPAWDEFLVLPVIGRSQVLLGGLSRSSLRRGLLEPLERPARGSVTRELAVALVATASGLLKLIASDTSSLRIRGYGENSRDY